MDLISIEILNNDVLRKQENNELLNDLNVEENLKENENEANNNEDIQDEEEEQDDLTNLAWLTELRNQRHNSILYSGEFEYETTTINTGLGTGTTQLLNADDDYNTTTTTSTTLQNDMPKNFQKQQHQQNSIDGKQQQTQKATIKRPTPMERFETFCKKVKRDLAEYEKSSIEYQTMEADKPPFNYSHIIGMVMLEKGRVTLQQICAWIELKFAYFRTRKKWNNSIRHNLSLHPCFRKIDRKKYEKGKGGYWELGIDLKKCERKRIRHRKNVQKQQKVQQQQEQQQNHDVDHDLMSGDVSEKDLEFVDDELNGEQQTHQQQNDTEFLLDDEFDVQQNIDITSCCHKQQQQQQHEQNIHFIEQQKPQLQQQQPQQFQLGTIIISGGGASPTNCSSFVTTTPLQSTNWQNYYEITDTPITLKNRPNVIVEEIHTTSHQHQQQQQQQQQQHRSLLLANLLSPTITTNTTTIAGGTATTKTFNQQFDGDGEENVVITTCSNNNDISFFQPITSTTTTTTEIDSIEEAFQYLRSLDTNNRDDSFLDNFFDVSVSDF